ncbi:MAG TPA: PilN domain-containing protein [Pyrinomonadaceae bacterium]
MIKVNLLDSVTDRARSVAVVEAKVANPRARSMMLMAAVFSLMALGMIFEYVSANSAHAAAQAELERQEQIAKQMEAVNKEQAELEKKIQAIQVRIEAIKKLRASQKGPVAVLSEINQRMPAVAEFRLESIEQKNGELVIEGHSPNEAAVTEFGRKLEFSEGLFTNVNLETQRKDLEVNVADYKDLGGEIDLTVKPQTVRFKIKCKYGPTSEKTAQQPGAPAPNAPANQIAQK